MTNQHTIVYVMRHIDIGGYIEIPYKKVGITGRGNATLTDRLEQISNTKSPIKAQCIAAWQHDNARAVEYALHQLLEDNRVEGEWFYDKDDTLVDRMQPIMELLGAEKIEIEGAEDSYTKNILKRESESKSAPIQALQSEILERLTEPLRTSIRQGGPTFFSDTTNLTYYVKYRQSGNHHVHIDRSRERQDQLIAFLEEQGYDVEPYTRGVVKVHDLQAEQIAELINTIESNFNPKSTN